MLDLGASVVGSYFQGGFCPAGGLMSATRLVYAFRSFHVSSAIRQFDGPCSGPSGQATRPEIVLSLITHRGRTKVKQ